MYDLHKHVFLYTIREDMITTLCSCCTAELLFLFLLLRTDLVCLVEGKKYSLSKFIFERFQCKYVVV